MLDLVKIFAGLALLFYGGNYLVTGSVRLARVLKISPFVIGATIIAFGTSAPELSVAILASLQGTSELAMGNVIGSNIANIGLVLGLTTLIAPLYIKPDRLKRESPPFLLATFLILVIAWNLEIGRYEGLFMVFLLGLYILRSFSHKEDFNEELEDEVPLFAGKGPSYQIFLIIAGLGILVGGAKLLVAGGVGIARDLGISEWFIGITIVAVGTSLPEIVSSVIAAKRGHGEMAIGNIFGSNIFNILMVLGLTATIHPLQIKEPIEPDLLIATAITLLLLGMIRYGNYSLGKAKGGFLIVIYCIYIGLKGTGTL
ncbi:MAG: calcium/sodium antiporter [Nitrospina sp.]|nr:calcium/sodium antiporter [Nitrospina sp.]MBT3510242.1 calcium/sodium antiporter [Nitrospina sp.]MBT3876789.1 calcium/sodium antiporter [Nitrospina sp.]MBT4048145.1 calcium/sodium antiporter [Nitrospina sp.]MBT4556831.1 calcium/sodium antiporter [Nitrospina sp.]